MFTRVYRILATFIALLGMTAIAAGPVAAGDEPPALRWWKGNTHTHTLWSDGNGAPELVARWYVEHDYNFLVLSDHNILSTGEKWFPIAEGERSRLNAERVDELRNIFGDEWVEVRTSDDESGGSEMRLKTLDELRSCFEGPGAFIFIQGEEITDSFRRAPVHINAVNIEERIEPQHGESMREVIQRNIDAVIEHGRRHGRPTLAHVNHPNFGWALTAEDLAAIEGEHFFEVYNGHSHVRNYGDHDHPGTEAMWDIALAARLTNEPHLGVLYGIATDDSHEYFKHGVGHTNPGRGWVMVRCAELTPAAIIEALHAGDFYASSGVTLTDISVSGERYTIAIEESGDATFTTQFIGLRRESAADSDADRLGPIGEVLLETGANPAVYEFTGDEIYVRAKIISSRLHPNPYAEGDHEVAWTQPVLP